MWESNFGRRDRRNQEMASSLPASLFLLSVVFWQFVAAAGQTIVTATAGHEVVLPCKDPDKGRLTVAEWRRLDLGSRYVLLYRNKQIDPANQHPSFKNRVDLLTNQMYNGDASLILENASITDSGMFECQIVHANSEKKTILTVNLDVLPPPAPPTPPPPPELNRNQMDKRNQTDNRKQTDKRNQMGKRDKSDQTDHRDHVDQMDHRDQVDHSIHRVQSDESDQGNQTDKRDKSDQTDHRDHVDQTDHRGQVDHRIRRVQSDESDQGNQTDQMDKRGP
ncbi:uncharacterized protein LOC114157910 [Xiphophorus couchianus]|uniref:uncharacterized protein LOC114157910 n=1 Tax=Xiphophorus couchianus TaxID=32473 RepID=UPI001016A9FC|nr:uncharacterized protein LOC114157910 [Xiphophorus couchianus]